jgi:hypothetical protein
VDKGWKVEKKVRSIGFALVVNDEIPLEHCNL